MTDCQHEIELVKSEVDLSLVKCVVLLQKEMCDLQRRLQELQSRSVELEELEEPVLRACDPAQLRLMGRALEDIISSEHWAQISVSPPAEIIR